MLNLINQEAMQDAINTISGIIDMYPEVLNLKIIATNDIQLEWSNSRNEESENRVKTFSSAIDTLEWMEVNLLIKKQ